MKVLERAKELEASGRSVIHFEVGEPDLSVPEVIKRRAAEVVKTVELKYTESTGIRPLKEKIAEYYEKAYSINISPDQVIVTPGSSPGLLSVLKVVSEKVGKVSYADPGYPCYKNMLRFLNLESVSIPVNPESGFKISLRDLKTEVLILNSPSNPTGAIYSKKELEKLSEKVFLVSDEIYHGLVYSGKAPSVLEVTDRAVVVNGFSKFFLMTGWRLGWVVVPEWMVEDMTAVLQNIAISPPTLSQYAALVCFEEECLSELRRNVEIFKRRRDLMLQGLKEIGFRIPVEPEGAFYIFADVSEFTNDSYSFAFEVLEKTGVAITPGRDFGYNETDRFVRFSFCTDEKDIEEGLERLYRFLREGI